MGVTGDTFEFLAGQMANAETQWSLGTFGAIAEFMRDPDEPYRLARTQNCLSAVTARGGIRIVPPADLRVVAFETTTREGWSQRIGLCLAEERCAMNRRNVLTELGPDQDALRDEDRQAVLFDLGIDALQADICIRVADPEVVAKLRAHCGRALMEVGNPAMGIIIMASPHRVFISRVGRVEVYQAIPNANGTSPEGPHTHVLPNLLQHRRTHSATEQIPEGWIPCAHLYPAHAARDAMGHSRPFDPARHRAFQEMLKTFGDPKFVALKERVAAAIAAGEDPSVVTITDSRFARTNVRVALRQYKAEHAVPMLAAWTAAHERADHSGLDEETHGHR